MLRFLPLAIYYFLSFQVKADIFFEISPEIIECYRSGISFNITKMDADLDKLRKYQANNGFILLLENYRETILLLANEDHQAYRIALAAKNTRIERLKLAEDKSPYKYWCLAEVYLQWTLIRIRYHDEYRAANDLRKANNYLVDCRNNYQWFYLSDKTLAIIEALSSAVPNQYRWLANIAGLKGKKTDALQRLRFLKNKLDKEKTFNFLSPEIEFYILFISRNLNEDQVVEAFNTGNSDVEPALLKFSRIWIYSKSGNSTKVISEINSLKESIQGFNFCYLDYLKGEAELNQLKNPSKSLYSFLNCTKGNAFVKSAYRRLAWYALLQNKPTNYYSFLAKARTSGSTYLEDDKQANEESELGKVPNLYLLKARLLFDGGDYEFALTELSNGLPNYITEIDFTEYYYRKGRCYQAMNKELQSVPEFNQTIKKGKNLNAYFAASAAYNLGIIKKNSGQIDSARFFLKMVENFPKHAYTSSLSMKAAGILNSLP